MATVTVRARRRGVDLRETLPPVGMRPVWDALEHLRKARDLLARARCPKALGRVRRAIDSCEGAARHAALAPIRERRQVAKRMVAQWAAGGDPPRCLIVCPACHEQCDAPAVETASSYAGRQWQCYACASWQPCAGTGAV